MLRKFFSLFASRKHIAVVTALLLGGLVIIGVSADTTGTILPQSDGNYSQWSASGPAPHYQRLDESSCNGKGDYVKTNGVGDRDSYGVDISSIPNGALITDIQIIPCASKNKGGSGSATLDVFYRLDGGDSADVGNYNLTGTTPVGLSATTFSGLDLTKNSSSMLEIGAVLSGGNKGARLSRIETVVTYEITPSSPSALSATASSTNANLNWSDNSDNEDGFKIERGINGVDFNQIDIVGENVTGYEDAGLSSGNYYYRVRAFNTVGNSGYSNTASTTIP